MSLEQYYSDNKQYGNRYYSDAEKIDFTAEKKYSGIIDRNIHFVTKNQLMNADDWYLFIKQFACSADDVNKGWRGEYFGKVMRGACMCWQYTHDEKLYSLLSEVAAAMLETQDNEGRISTYSPSCEFQGWDIWCRKYVLLGLLHFHEICKDGDFRDKVVKALEKHLDYIVVHVGGNGKIDFADTSTFWGAINSASILEPIMKMYNITKKQSYLDFAREIIDFLLNGETNIFKCALDNKVFPYQYPTTKAYEMMSCFEGLLEYYRLTGEEWCLEATENFADRVKQSDITIIGCAGCEHELFNNSVVMQTDTSYDGVMQETCVTVTWMKFCNQLLLLTGNPQYADYIEISYYNAFYGAVNTRLCTSNHGYVFDSYSPLTYNKRARLVGGEQRLSDTRACGCCAAIGSAGAALPALTSVLTCDKGICVNYYESGNIKINGFELEFVTNYPEDGKIGIKFLKAPEDEKEVSFRIPGFAGRESKLFVNNEQYIFEKSGSDGIYVNIKKVWEQGDAVEISLDMNGHIILPKDLGNNTDPDSFFAVMYGPLVLAKDSKISDINKAVKLSDDFKIIPKDKQGIDCLFRADVAIGSEVMDMIDYGSAGKDWDNENYVEAWIKTEN